MSNVLRAVSRDSGDHPGFQQAHPQEVKVSGKLATFVPTWASERGAVL